MIEVTGEGARFWSRWRGPSGQGLVAPGKYANTWSPTTNIKWRVQIPGAGNSSPIVWGDRIYVTTAQEGGSKLSMLALNRADGRKLWETVVPQEGVEHVHQKNGHASATPVDRRAGDLCVLWPSRPRGVRHRRQDPVASPVRRHRQLSRAGRLAGALQGPRLPVSGSRGLARAARVRRGLRRQDGQDAVGDAAD